MKYTIYIIKNNINDKCYIGQHILKSENNRQYMGKGLGIQEAYKQYGRQHFYKEILEIVEDNTAKRLIVSEREKYWIKKLNTLEPNGYNRHPGGIGGSTKQSSQKSVETRKLNGYNHTQQTKDKISKSHKGKTFSQEHKKHLSENHRLIKTWTLVHEDGTETKYKGSLHTLVEQLNLGSFNKLIRHSYKKEFINGIYIKNIKKEDYSILNNPKNKKSTLLCNDPIIGDICTFKALYLRKRRNPNLYKNININNQIIKEKGEFKNEV